MRSADPIRFEPSEPYQDLARIVALLDTNYVGTLAERPDGVYEFIPHRSGPFCIALRLSDGLHIAVSFKAMEAVVWRLMKERQAHDQLARLCPRAPKRHRLDPHVCI